MELQILNVIFTEWEVKMIQAEALTHIDGEGNVSMVDVSAKKPQLRIAKARGKILLSSKTLSLIQDNEIQKGDVLATAKIAGIQAAKWTAHLIPLCHPLPISKVDIQTTLVEDGVMIESEVRCLGKTGVEMEALTAVHISLLTIYDMCKAVDKNMVVQEIKLISKIKKDL